MTTMRATPTSYYQLVHTRIAAFLPGDLGEDKTLPSTPPVAVWVTAVRAFIPWPRPMRQSVFWSSKAKVWSFY